MSGYVDRYDPGASSSPYLARQIVSSPAAEPVLGELSFDRLKRAKATHLIFLLNQVEPEERRMRAAASEGGGLSFGDAVQIAGMFAPTPCKVAAAACRAAAGAAAKAGVAAGKAIGETATKAPGWIAKTLRPSGAKGASTITANKLRGDASAAAVARQFPGARAAPTLQTSRGARRWTLLSLEDVASR